MAPRKRKVLSQAEIALLASNQKPKIPLHGAKLNKSKDGAWLFYCPGCKTSHRLTSLHRFSGNLEQPTFMPGYTNERRECKLFITNGMLRFRPDSAHSLAGQTIVMPDWPYDRDK